MRKKEVKVLKKISQKKVKERNKQTTSFIKEMGPEFDKRTATAFGKELSGLIHAIKNIRATDKRKEVPPKFPFSKINKWVKKVEVNAPNGCDIYEVTP